MSRLHRALILVFIVIFPLAGSAEPMSVYGSTDDPGRSIATVSIRAGVGSLFGPAFRAGQPEYAQSDGFDWENREPFTTPHQIVATFGFGGTLAFNVGEWAVGPTLLGGFNATRGGSGDFSDISLSQSHTGGTFGAGVHGSRGHGPLKFTLDVLGSYSSLSGRLEWSYSDFFGDETLVGDGEWETSYLRVAALAGLELDLAPVFLFANAGAQFLPEQRRERHVFGSFPEAHTNDPFNVEVVADVRKSGRATVTYEQELQFAASAGIGVRF